jgi:hypothetical protein
VISYYLNGNANTFTADAGSSLEILPFVLFSQSPFLKAHTSIAYLTQVSPLCWILPSSKETIKAREIA